VKGFSQLGAPLIDLTRKGVVIFSEEAQKTFDIMKTVMSNFPVLALPYFC
jgi:hypothetical protein